MSIWYAMFVPAGTPEELGSLVRSEIVRFTKVAASAGLQKE
jgi:tripartite-type tricarboxylate transporter receptor subunit TctC